jgi:hypothetical protein
MLYAKLTPGWVRQTFDSETGDCVGQEFVPGEEVQRVDEEGKAIEDANCLQELQNTEKECPFDMVQP